MNPVLIPALDGTSKWILKACAVGILLAIAGTLTFSWGHARGKASMEAPLAKAQAATAAAEGKRQADLAAHARVLREYAEQAAHVAELARQSQSTFILDREAARQKFKKEMADALAKRDSLVAGYRAGTVQLQSWWECPSVLPAASGAFGADPAAHGPGVDGAAALRAASLAEGVQDGAAADAWIHNLQAELSATRRACAPQVQGIVP